VNIARAGFDKPVSPWRSSLRIANMGYVKTAMIEARNMAKDTKHFQQELRNCMYNLTDAELLAVLAAHPMEAERLRQCLRTIDIEQDEDVKET